VATRRIGDWIVALSAMFYKFEIFHCVNLLTVQEMLSWTVCLNSNQGLFSKLWGCSGCIRRGDRCLLTE